MNRGYLQSPESESAGRLGSGTSRSYALLKWYP